MFDVTIRKKYCHPDGSCVVYEDPGQVNHERHAENLAAKIARDPGVQWVEVEETRGRFKARAHIGRDGTVYESLEAKGYRARPKGRYRRLRRTNRQYVWVVLAALLFLTLLELLIIGK